MTLTDEERREINALWEELKDNRKEIHKEIKITNETVMQLRLQQNNFQQELRTLTKELGKTHGEFTASLHNTTSAVRGLGEDFLKFSTKYEASNNTSRRFSDKFWAQYFPAVVSLLALGIAALSVGKAV